MDKKKQIALFSVMLVVLAGLIWGLLTSYPRDVANDLPLPNEKAYTNKVNQWLIEKTEVSRF